MQPDLIGAGIIVPIAGPRWQARSCSFGIKMNMLRRHSSEEADVQRHAPLDLCRAVSIGANSPKRSGGFKARYRCKVAPRPVQVVLALEVATPWWPAKLIDRDTQAYPRDEHRQPVVRSVADPRRVDLKLGIDIGQTNVAKYMEAAWLVLAGEQDWLDGEISAQVARGSDGSV